MDLQNEVTRILAKARFKYRSDTKENWEKENPVLLSGEIGVVIDGSETEKAKWGDGKTPWNSLGWWKGPKGDTGAAGKDGINGTNGTDGVSIAKTEINSNGELIITLSDNTVSNLGVVVGDKTAGVDEIFIVIGKTTWSVEYLLEGVQPNTLELYLSFNQLNKDKESVDQLYEEIKNGTITELPTLFYKDEDIPTRNCVVVEDNTKRLLVEVDDISKISPDDLYYIDPNKTPVALKADNATHTVLPNKTNILKEATLEVIGMVNGEEVTLHYNSGTNSIFDKAWAPRGQWQLPSAYKSVDADKNTCIQSTFTLPDFTNLNELRLNWDNTQFDVCRWYEIFVSDNRDTLYDKPLYEYNSLKDKTLVVGNPEQIFNLYLNNVKYIGIRYYHLQKGTLVLPVEFFLTSYNLRNLDFGSVGTRSLFAGQTALGRFNDPKPDALVSVGNGTSDEDRHNALEVLFDGSLRFESPIYAPSITNSLRGNAVFASDVSPLEHDLKIKLSSDTAEDLSGISLNQFGKNLLPMGKDNWEHGVGDFTFDTEGVYGKYGSGASDFTMCATKYPSGTYSFSAEFSYKSDGSTSRSRILARCFDAEGNILTDVYSNYNVFYKAFILPLDDVLTFTIPDTVAYWQLGWVAMEVAIGNPSSMKFPQLERGDTITPYEPCVVRTATANADGTVEGLKSISPNMALIPDTDNVVIEVSYIADTKRYIDNKFIELKSELQALILEV